MKLPGSHNWGLKLLALVLAVILYHALKTDSSSTKADISNDRKFFQTP